MTKEQFEDVLKDIVTDSYESERLEKMAMSAQTESAYAQAARLMNAAGQRVGAHCGRLVAEFERLKKLAGEA